MASSGAWRSQLLSASSLCHLVMKHSAASPTPRYHYLPFLAAVGHSTHSTVSTPNTKGTLSVDHSVARNTLTSSSRHWTQFFSGRPGPGFSPPGIVPNTTRWVSRSLVFRCTTPAKRRRRLRMVVSTLSSYVKETVSPQHVSEKHCIDRVYWDLPRSVLDAHFSKTSVPHIWPVTRASAAKLHASRRLVRTPEYYPNPSCIS